MIHPILWLSHWLDRLAAGVVPLDFDLAFEPDDILADLRFGRG